jgi:TetR/AcrR family transcriptional repressor of nem operon
MKVTREQAAENRDRVLQTASTLFRERGFGGIGVADLMKSAGMTHGAFYGQFESKEDLMAQACALAVRSTIDRWQGRAADTLKNGAPAEALAQLVKSYLSKDHRDAPGGGCVLASLGSDVAREGPAVRAAVTEGTLSMLDLLTQLTPGESDAERREQAIATYAGMIGGLVLSRTVDDDALSKEILEAVSAAVLAHSP